MLDQQMAGAVDAIFGQSSAHSFATGPVIPDPFISPLMLTMTPALSSKYTQRPSRRRHAFLWRITTAWHTFLRSSGLPFFHSCKDQISASGLWQTTQLAANSFHCNHVQILGSAIVSTIHDSSHIQTKRHAQFGLPSCTSTLHICFCFGVGFWRVVCTNRNLEPK